MKTLEPDWQHQRPNQDAVRTMWSKIRFENIPITHPEILHFIHDLKVAYPRGGALLYHFQVAENVTFDWFAYNNRLAEIDFVGRALGSGDIISAAAELSIDKSLLSIESVTHLPDSFDMAGRLARHLYHGGPHSNQNIEAKEVLRIAEQFIEQIIQNRYEEVSVMLFDTAWADWFYDEYWDMTYLLYDRIQRQIWLLCLTDSQ
ncbi:MAG: hypothetical protein AAFN10_00085 [Bacteroidota bacterium]